MSEEEPTEGKHADPSSDKLAKLSATAASKFSSFFENASVNRFKRLTCKRVDSWWPSESELNRLGAEGWELVSVAVSSNENGAETIKAYLKRPISD